MDISIRAKIIILLMFLIILSSVIVGFYMITITTKVLDNPENSNPSDRLKGEALAVIVATFFITSVISYFYAKSLTAPIEKLIIGTQLVAKGQFDYRIKKRTNDEVGKLVDNFNRMIDNLRAEREERSRYSSLASQEKSKSELIIDSMADSVIVTDKSLNVLIFNPSAEQLFSIPRKDVLKKNIVHFLRRFKMEDLFYDIPEGSQKKRYLGKSREMSLEIDNSQKFVKATVAPVRDEKKRMTGSVIVIQDITKLKEIDNLKSEFISTVSHELRTPLTCITGYSTLLNDKKLGTLNDKQGKAISVINKESEKLTHLVNDLLDLSKLEAGKMTLNKEEVELEKCVNDSPAIPLAKRKNITLQVIYPKNLPKIKIDRIKITQVFTNLLSNAIKFTDEKGKIMVRLSNLQDFIKAEVSDTGIGIAKKNLPRLFNKFYQVDSHLTRTQGGTGLGLAIVKEIIGLHGGVIGIDSRPKSGTRITFILPKFDIDQKNMPLCYEVKNCQKTRCPQFNSKVPRCFIVPGTFSKDHEPCFDKVSQCMGCEVYRRLKG